jgi:hypothetical protein
MRKARSFSFWCHVCAQKNLKFEFEDVTWVPSSAVVLFGFGV